MPEKQFEIVPLTDDEREWLMTIYKTRSRNLFIAFFGYMIIFAVPSYLIGFFLRV